MLLQITSYYIFIPGPTDKDIKPLLHVTLHYCILYLTSPRWYVQQAAQAAPRSLLQDMPRRKENIFCETIPLHWKGGW